VGSFEDSQRLHLLESYRRNFTAGEVIFRQDEPATSVFVLQEGHVRLVKRVRLVERNLVVLGPGDLFGETALLGPREGCPSTAVTLTECAVLCFEAARFDSLVTSHSELALRLMRQLVRRLREAEDQVENMLIRDKQSRVVNALVKAGKLQGGQDTQSVRVKMTPVELSSCVGLDVDTVKRAVHELRKGDYLKVYDDQLVISDMDALQKLFELIGMKEDLQRA
jgi:CRP-like cAMP-binding protein